MWLKGTGSHVPAPAPCELQPKPGAAFEANSEADAVREVPSYHNYGTEEHSHLQQKLPGSQKPMVATLTTGLQTVGQKGQVEREWRISRQMFLKEIF